MRKEEPTEYPRPEDPKLPSIRSEAPYNRSERRRSDGPQPKPPLQL